MRTRAAREGANGLFSGSRFPSEPELTREFGVSRTLVRGVLGRLTRDGLIRREAKRGTFVSARRGRARGPELSDLMERLLDWGPYTVAKVLGTNTTVGALDVKARLRLPAAAALVVIRRLVLQHGTPVSYTVSFLPYELGSRLGILRERRATTVFITHDIAEAVFLSDRIFLRCPSRTRTDRRGEKGSGCRERE